MSIPVDLAATLSGASVSQLRRWSRSGLFIPEVNESRPMLYSFRDVVALRSVARLRDHTSLQRIRRAFARLSEVDLTEHPSVYRFGTDGKTIVAFDVDGEVIDLVEHPGQYELVTLEDIYRPFQTRRGRDVVDFRRPREHLEVSADRLGGFPVIAGTRITYDVIARAVDGVTITAQTVSEYWPGVTAAAAEDAISLDREVRRIGGAA